MIMKYKYRNWGKRQQETNYVNPIPRTVTIFTVDLGNWGNLPWEYRIFEKFQTSNTYRLS